MAIAKKTPEQKAKIIIFHLNQALDELYAVEESDARSEARNEINIALEWLDELK